MKNPILSLKKLAHAKNLTKKSEDVFIGRLDLT
jgi:hypothetical protein